MNENKKYIIQDLQIICKDGPFKGLVCCKPYLCSVEAIQNNSINTVNPLGSIYFDDMPQWGVGASVGEISLKSTWVKKGDQFNEDEVQAYFYDPALGGECISSSNERIIQIAREKKLGIKFKFKCPTCNNFH